VAIETTPAFLRGFEQLETIASAVLLDRHPFDRMVRWRTVEKVLRGLSANENARALISMMARSKCSNQRPDTLMQDRSPPIRRIFLQRTAGPYIRVKHYRIRPLGHFPV
jgi:hypothetical protein